jgi:hypothetical protein
MIERVDFRERFRQMSDDELLDVAKDANSLVPEARGAIEAELCNRKLSGEDVEQFAAETARLKEEHAKSTAVQFQFRGFGTIFCGKRDFAGDESYTTTRWVAISGIPVIPLGSYRLRPVRPRPLLSYLGWGGYEVLGKTKLDIRQVVYVYGFFVLLIWGFLHSIGSKNEMRAKITLGLLCFAPWALRQYARANARLRDAESVDRVNVLRQ